MPTLSVRFWMTFSRPLNAHRRNEQDVGRVDLHEFLIRVFPAALWRHREAIVPSMSFSKACWTPSPLTSRVIDGLSDFLEILSISSI